MMVLVIRAVWWCLWLIEQYNDGSLADRIHLRHQMNTAKWNTVFELNLVANKKKFELLTLNISTKITHFECQNNKTTQWSSNQKNAHLNLMSDVSSSSAMTGKQQQ